VKPVALGLLFVVTCACYASAAGPVRVSLAAKRPTPVAGRSWTLRLVVRPVSFRGTIRVTASGRTRIVARASGRRGSYRARLVFPTAGRWRLTARAGRSTSRLGAVRVRPAPPRPLTFSEPTSIDLEPGGTLLLVENNPGSLLRVNPRTGRVTTLVSSISRPYAAVRARAGSVYLSSQNVLWRLDEAGALTTVAEAETNREIGPVAAAPNGDVYYSTATQIFRLPGGAGPPVRVAGTGVPGGGGDGGRAVDAQPAAS
jgi:hypothetical protein